MIENGTADEAAAQVSGQVDQGISRRALLSRSAAGGLGLVLAGDLGGMFGSQALGRGRGAGRAAGYGPLITDPKGLLSLPKRFTYELVAEAGVTEMDDGNPTPSDPDGTASFVRKGGNGSVLVMNHELDGSEPFPVPHRRRHVYDASASGGTTTLTVNRQGKRVGEYVSLAGTHVNCAGGRTPWETWISCEETDVVLDKPHGYCFEVDPYNQRNNEFPQPMKCLGRFSHESIVVDPHTQVIYQTEDASGPNGLLYRWVPPRYALPLGRRSLRHLRDDAGKLEALRAFTNEGDLVPDLSLATSPGTKYKAKWVRVPDRDAAQTHTREQFGAEITRSRKLEGMWWGDGGAYFTASFARITDGSAVPHDGQVWFLDPDTDTLELKLRFSYTAADQDSDPDGPDNITVSPYGGLIIAEDGEGLQHLIGSTERGKTFFFARNERTEEGSEFTGPTFSRDRKTLFANVQTPGSTYAITGPFRKQK